MNPLHYQALQKLCLCTFLPGSWDKRFVHDLGRLGEYDLLTPKQEACVEALAYRYCKQLKMLGFRLPGAFLDAVDQRRRAEKAKVVAEVMPKVKAFWQQRQSNYQAARASLFDLSNL